MMVHNADTLRQRLDGFDPALSLMLVDFDGVVVDSEPIQYRAYASVLSAYGVAVSPEDFRRYIGSSEDQVLERVQRDHGCVLDLTAVKQQRAVALDAEFAALAAPNWFVGPALEWVHERAGSVRVASAGHRHRIAATLDRFGLAHLVDAIHTVPDQPAGTTKTDLIDALIGPAPSTTVVIEDNPRVLAHVAQRGCRTIAVHHDYNVGSVTSADIHVSARPAS